MVATPGGTIGAWIASPGHFIGVGFAGRRAEHARAFWAVAITRCDVAVLPSDVLFNVVDALSPEGMLNLMTQIHSGLSRHVFDRSIMLSLGTAERLFYLLDRIRAVPQFAPGGGRILLRLRRRDLADVTGENLAQISRALAELKAAHRLEVNHDGLFVLRYGPARL
jgi:CRP-like cAMP-binding protein